MAIPPERNSEIRFALVYPTRQRPLGFGCCLLAFQGVIPAVPFEWGRHHRPLRSSRPAFCAVVTGHRRSPSRRALRRADAPPRGKLMQWWDVRGESHATPGGEGLPTQPDPVQWPRGRVVAGLSARPASLASTLTTSGVPSAARIARSSASNRITSSVFTPQPIPRGARRPSRRGGSPGRHGARLQAIQPTRRSGPGLTSTFRALGSKSVG